jgi:hypothetical protein
MGVECHGYTRKGNLNCNPIDCMRVVVTYCGSPTFDGELGTFAGIHLPSGNQSRSMVFHFF